MPSIFSGEKQGSEGTSAFGIATSIFSFERSSRPVKRKGKRRGHRRLLISLSNYKLHIGYGAQMDDQPILLENSPMDDDIEIFCRQVRARSQEHFQSIPPLLAAGSFGVAVGLLRQELDSLVRVAYLDEIDMSSPKAHALMSDSVNGRQWTRVTSHGRQARITDREMVDIAKSIGGWVRVIYSFGCKLIHLSDAHDHATVDPFSKLTDEQRQEIVGYLHNYHQYPHEDVDTDRFVEYLPKVMRKLVDNVEFYLTEITRKNNQAEQD